MKKNQSILLLFILVVNTTLSQIIPTSGTWASIGNVTLTTVYDDADNGDGVGDGAIFVNGLTAVVGQGASYTFGGTMQSGQSVSISTYTYNRNSSYVNFTVDLYNKTDNKVLKTSATISHLGSVTTPVNTILNYTTVASDAGDELQVRYIRNDDGATSRDFAIDNVIFNTNIATAGPCPFTLTPDLPLIASNATIETQITNAVNRFSDSYLGTSAPTATALNNAVTAYNALNIVVSGGTITGNATANFGVPTFLKTFAQYLKFNPTNPDPRDIKTMANNTVWWVSKQFCDGTLATDVQLYSYQVFARPASLLQNFLDPTVKSLFSYSLYQHTRQFQHFWAPTYDSAYQQANGTIITDLIYNLGDALLAYSLWQDTPEERYRYMRAYKRHTDRFFSYTVGTNDGIKPDGNGFHHNIAYNGYMPAYNTAANMLSYLSGTPFQVEQANYQVFRNAFYTQYIEANDAGVQAFATAGRNPQNRTIPLSKAALKTLAVTGGTIMGLSTADPILAGMYNRIYGVDAAFNYSTVAPFPEGFFQFNHTNASAFRKNNWLVFNKGFSNSLMGAELYTNQNRYGRYQSYGALEIIYPGDKATGNGYDDKTWDWNFNPGTTVINLPWAKLHGEWSRIDEVQKKKFVGTLSFSNKNSELLTNNHGSYGMFAMDFQEDTNTASQGFGTNYTGGVQNHNSTFTFKKSNFYFDDIIVCLGSGITNNDTSNETVTTLFQRLDNKGIGVNVNGTMQTTGLTTYSGASNNWLISNYGTGFYLVSGNDSFVVKNASQKTPNQDQTWFPAPLDFSANPSATYYTGYINHGTNPSNKKYEYILKPNSNATEMLALDANIQSANKPYTVIRQDATAHIVQHIAKKIWGYAFFTTFPTLPSTGNYANSPVTGIDGSCLVMTQNNDVNNTLLVSIDNPDIGFVKDSYAPSIQVTRQLTLKGQWSLSTTYPGVQILSSTTTATVIQFTLVDGLAKEILLNSGDSTTWNGTVWSNGLPTSILNAIIAGNYIVGTDLGSNLGLGLSAKSLTVNNNALVAIPSTNKVTIAGPLDVSSGSFTLENNANLLQTTNATNTGDITVKRASAPLFRLDYSMWSSPTGTTQKLNEFSPLTATGRFYTYNAATNVYTSIPSTTPFSTGKGFLIRMPNTWVDYVDGSSVPASWTGSFTGIPNNGDVNSIGLTAGTYNAVGNPYPSTLSADKFIDANSAGSGAGTLYFWRKRNGTTVTSAYATYTKAGPVGLPAGSGAAGDSGITPTGDIQVGQGFITTAPASGTISFTNAMRTSSTTAPFLRTKLVEKNRVWLNLSTSTEPVNQMMIAYMDGATSGIDYGIDGKYINDSGTALTSAIEGGEYVIQGRALPFDPSDVVALNFKTDTAGTFTITKDSADGIFATTQDIYLVDAVTGTETNLQTDAYTFTAAAGTSNERFSLKYQKTLSVNAAAFNDNTIKVYRNHSILTVSSGAIAISNIKVYDLQGRVLSEQKDVNANMATINNLRASHQVILVKVTSVDNDVVTKKVIN